MCSRKGKLLKESCCLHSTCIPGRVISKSELKKSFCDLTSQILSHCNVFEVFIIPDTILKQSQKLFKWSWDKTFFVWLSKIICSFTEVMVSLLWETVHFGFVVQHWSLQQSPHWITGFPRDDGQPGQLLTGLPIALKFWSRLQWMVLSHGCLV